MTWKGAIFRRITQNLVKSGFQRTMVHNCAEMKARKKNYKEITRRMRSGAGHEPNKEKDMPADFSYFDLLESVMDGRATVTPVHLQDSATAGVGKVQSPATSVPTASSLQDIPSYLASNQQDTPGPSASNQQDTPGPSASNQQDTPGPSASSQQDTPGPSASSRPTSPVVVDIPVPKKKRKWDTNVQ